MKWKRLRPHQYAWCEAFVVLWFVCVVALVGFYIVTDAPIFVYVSCAVGILGSLCTVFMYLSVWKQRKVSVLMENFVRRNNMYRSHYNTESGVFGERHSGNGELSRRIIRDVDCTAEICIDVV